MLNYSGKVDEVNVTITEKTTSGEHGGWIHNWTIDLQITTPEGTFTKQHQFSTQQDSPAAHLEGKQKFSRQYPLTAKRAVDTNIHHTVVHTNALEIRNRQKEKSRLAFADRLQL